MKWRKIEKVMISKMMLSVTQMKIRDNNQWCWSLKWSVIQKPPSNYRISSRNASRVSQGKLLISLNNLKLFLERNSNPKPRYPILLRSGILPMLNFPWKNRSRNDQAVMPVPKNPSKGSLDIFEGLSEGSAWNFDHASFNFNIFNLKGLRDQFQFTFEVLLHQENLDKFSVFMGKFSEFWQELRKIWQKAKFFP